MPRAALTPRTVTGLQALLELLDRCRQDGWACADGELETGVRSMAVPVRDRQGVVIAAMSIAMRAERMGLREFRETLLAPLMRARSTLEDRLYPA